MTNKNVGTVLSLLIFTLLTACGDPGDKADTSSAIGKDKAGGVQSMPVPGADATSTDGPTAESVELEMNGSPVAITRIYECAATPGRGLGFSAMTDDHVGDDGSAGVRVGGGFEYKKGQLLITYQSKKWIAKEGTGDLSFNQVDTRTGDGRSFVTVKATGKAIAGTEELPFSLVVTCEPGGT